MTPYQAWSGRIPTVVHFRIFGCIAYVKHVQPYLKKLKDRSDKMVLLGYEPGSKAYRFVNPLTMRITVSRDVIFEEEESWNWGHLTLNTLITTNAPFVVSGMKESMKFKTQVIAKELPATPQTIMNEDESHEDQ